MKIHVMVMILCTVLPLWGHKEDDSEEPLSKDIVKRILDKMPDSAQKIKKPLLHYIDRLKNSTDEVIMDVSGVDSSDDEALVWEEKPAVVSSLSAALSWKAVREAYKKRDMKVFHDIVRHVIRSQIKSISPADQKEIIRGKKIRYSFFALTGLFVIQAGVLCAIILT